MEFFQEVHFKTWPVEIDFLCAADVNAVDVNFNPDFILGEESSTGSFGNRQDSAAEIVGLGVFLLTQKEFIFIGVFVTMYFIKKDPSHFYYLLY